MAILDSPLGDYYVDFKFKDRLKISYRIVNNRVLEPNREENRKRKTIIKNQEIQ